MNKLVSDQADGLRRLMARHSGGHPTRVVALVGSSPMVGATSVALNLSAALAQQGKEVLLLDETGGAQSACAIWNIQATGVWADVTAQRLSLGAAAGRADCGVLVMPIAEADRTPDSGSTDLRALFQGQVLLIDARLDSDGALSPLAAQADDVVVILRPQAASITAAYACIKRLHYVHALQQLRIMINGAASLPEAQRVQSNLASTGSRYLALALEPAGCVVTDPHLPHAHQLHRTVVEAFQTSPAAVDFRRIATELLVWPWRPRTAASHSQCAAATIAV